MPQSRIRLILLAAFFIIPTPLVARAASYALVYSGPGACLEGCAAAAAKIAEKQGLKVRYVSADTLNESSFKKAVVWIQPGGDAIDVAKRLSPEQLEMIRGFVRQGGGYLGFCAGGFLADTTVDNETTIPGLGLFAGSSRDYGTPKRQTMVALNWENHLRYVYLEDGGYFDIPPEANARVLAHYPEGFAATIAVAYGKGRVAVTGVHPEAPDEWKIDAGLRDPDGSDEDLAAQMLRIAIGRDPL